MALRTKQIKSACGEDVKNCQEKKREVTDSFVYAPIDHYGKFGRFIRHKLLDGILVGTPVLLTIQKHRNPARTKVMKLLSFLGTEDFYTMFIVCLIWLLDTRLGRLFSILMWCGFYTTGFLKTLLCLPRPPSPVVPLEKTYDWALPSLHSLLGVILPWYIWLYAVLHYELFPAARGVICIVIVLWSIGVLLSRLYLGVHSPADIVCGGIVGVVVLCLWLQIDDYIDFYISQPSIEPQLKLVGFIFVLMCIHPVTEPGNPSFIDTFCVFGVITGIIIGRSQRSRTMGMPPLLEIIDEFSLFQFIMCSVLRLLLGGILIQLIRIGLKIVFLFILERLYQLIGVSYFNSSKLRRSMPPNTKHFSKTFVLPPIHEGKIDSDSDSEVDHEDSELPKKPIANTRGQERAFKWYDHLQLGNAIHTMASKRSSAPWDITIPVKYVVYSIMSYVAMEYIPRLFLFLNI